MNWRFRRKIKIAPHVWVNLNKGPPSVSLGEGPFTVNVGERGVRGTASARGTGLSVSETIPWGQRRALQQVSVSPAQPRKRRHRWLALAAVAVLWQIDALLIWALASGCVGIGGCVLTGIWLCGALVLTLLTSLALAEQAAGKPFAGKDIEFVVVGWAILFLPWFLLRRRRR